MRRIASTVIILALCIAALSGCGQSAKQAEEIKKRDTTISGLQAKVSQLEAEAMKLRSSPPTLPARVTLYFLKSTPKEFFLVPEERGVTIAAPQTSATQVMEAALKELIAGPQTSGLQPVLPKDARVISVKADKGLATVNFSKEITRLNVGSSGEALVIAAIANTLTRLGDVDRVQILVDGKAVETLAGHVDIRGPVRRNDAVVLFQ